MFHEPTETTAGIIRIEDHATDKMYLIIGSKRFVLVDAGVENVGDLPSLCDELVGGRVPVDLFIGNGHPDHVAQAGNCPNDS
jgi:glyoxylase-like metal-dependent hydrolase (beta-lactamase superfamily II)